VCGHRALHSIEFERLTAPKEGPTIFQEVSFSRLDGVTTFLILYSTFMAVQGRKVLILAGSTADQRYFESHADEIISQVKVCANGGRVNVVVGLNQVRGNSYDQVIGDNSPLTFTSNGRFTEVAITLIPGRSAMDTPWVLYHTVE